MTKFSVIIPLFNKQEYIKRAVDSVLNQNISDFELIIVNDGSTDKSLSVINKYTDSRIKIVNQKNMGQSAARNRGIKESKGELKAFLDADDEYKSNFLETILKLSKMFPDAGIYATNYEKIINKKRKIKTKIEGIQGNNWEGIMKDYFKASLGIEPPFNSSSLCIPETILNAVGIFNENEKYCEDLELFARIAVEYKIAYSNSACSLYHRDDKISFTKTSNLCFINLRMIEFLENFIKAAKNLSANFTDSINEYINKWRLESAKDCVLIRENHRAKSILKKIVTRTFKYKKLLVIIWAHMPFWLSQIIYKLKKKIFAN